MIKNIIIIIVFGFCLLITGMVSYDSGYQAGCNFTDASYSKITKDLKENLEVMLK